MEPCGTNLAPAGAKMAPMGRHNMAVWGPAGRPKALWEANAIASESMSGSVVVGGEWK